MNTVTKRFIRASSAGEGGMSCVPCSGHSRAMKRATTSDSMSAK